MILTLALDTAPIAARIEQIDRILMSGSKADARRMIDRLRRDLPDLTSQMIVVKPGP